MSERESTRINSVDKAMTLLELLAEKPAAASLQELTERSGYSKSTVHALLSTMARHNVVAREKGGRYRLGARLFSYGCAVAAEWDVPREARPYLEELAARTGASAFLALIDGPDAVVVDRCDGGAALRVTVGTGSRLPLHATSQGKLLLAQLEDGEALARAAAGGWQAYTPHTLVEPDALRAALAEIRANGYAVEDGEYKIGLRSVSAPVRDNGGSVRCALGVVGLFRNTRSDEFHAAVRQTVAAARRLSADLGWVEES